jgi:hypothetical protein
MQNPNTFKPDYLRFNLPGGTVYISAVVSATNKQNGKLLHSKFETATKAFEFAKRFIARWTRLYNAAVAIAPVES